LVVVQEIPHEDLKREGINLHYDMYISIPEIVLGVSKTIDTLKGKVKIAIDAGTQSGKILRLRGKGLPNLEGYGNGDLLIHVNVYTPRKISSEQRSFFEKMMHNENFKPVVDKSNKSFFEKVKDMFS